MTFVLPCIKKSKYIRNHIIISMLLSKEYWERECDSVLLCFILTLQVYSFDSVITSPTFCFYFQLLISTLRSNISLYVFPLTFGIQGGRRQHHIFSFIRRHAIFPRRISQKMHDWKAKQIFGDFSFECDIRQCW